MSYQKLLVILTSYFCAFAVLPTQMLALTTVGQKETNTKNIIEVAEYKPPTNIGSPPDTAAGGTRGTKCPQDRNISGPPLTALVPANDKWRLTVEGQPQFFVYLPQSSAKRAEFVLKAPNQKDVYRKSFPISGKAEIIGISLPKNVAALEKGKDYKWFFTILCDSQDRSRNPFVSELIRKQELDSSLAARVQKASLRDRSKLYAENGIWHDAVATLAELRRGSPNDATLVNEWKTLLQSAGLQEFSNVPITLTNLENSP